MTEQQKKTLRPKCRAMTEKYRGYNFIIDDESYFTLSHTTLPGNDRFYSNNVQLTPDHVKYKYQTKSGLSVNQEVYKDCLEQYLVPFVKKYQSTDDYVFWPDLATSHYAKSGQGYLRNEKFDFCPKR